MLTTYVIQLVAADVTGGGLDPITTILANGGILGAVLILTIFGKGLHSDDAYNLLKNERDGLRAVNSQLMTMLQVQVVPTMEKNVQVLQANTDKEKALMARLDTFLSKLEQVTSQEES